MNGEIIKQYKKDDTLGSFLTFFGWASVIGGILLAIWFLNNIPSSYGTNDREITALITAISGIIIGFFFFFMERLIFNQYLQNKLLEEIIKHKDKEEVVLANILRNTHVKANKEAE